MDHIPAFPSDIAFSPSVKAYQERRGSRAAYRQMEENQGWRTAINAEIASFIAAQTSIFLATVNAGGQPYIQHRGGPAGFLQVLDPRTIGFADFSGNRQYITAGNLADTSKACLFLIDYMLRRRVKIWGEARVVEGDAILTGRLMPGGYKARAERVILFDVKTLDTNCPQHIPQRFEAADVARVIGEKDARIADLEEELAKSRRDRNEK